MRNLDHPNVLKLVGVCVDAGSAPYIVMPFMINGSLLAHLRTEKRNLVFADCQQMTLVSLPAPYIGMIPKNFPLLPHTSAYACSTVDILCIMHRYSKQQGD